MKTKESTIFYRDHLITHSNDFLVEWKQTMKTRFRVNFKNYSKGCRFIVKNFLTSNLYNRVVIYTYF